MLQSFASILASYIAGDIRWFIAPVSLAPFLQCHTIDESSIFGKRCSLLSHELDPSRVQFDPVLSGWAVGSFALGLPLFRLFRETSKLTEIPTLEIIVCKSQTWDDCEILSEKGLALLWELPQQDLFNNTPHHRHFDMCVLNWVPIKLWFGIKAKKRRDNLKHKWAMSKPLLTE